MRLLLAALLLLTPLSAAAASPVQDDPVVEARAGLREPTALAPGERAADVEYASNLTGEEAIAAYLGCPAYGADAACTPEDAFVGGHVAPQGHDARVWAASDWKSAGASYDTRVAGHDIAVQAGTFHFWMLQYVYAEAFVDGERYGFFDAVPAPLP